MSVAQAETGTKGALSLSNEGELALTFIGAGSAFSRKFYQNNILLVKGDSHLLVDCGTRTPEALSMLGLSVGKIHNYLVTHSHADHIGGLEEVMLVNRYGLRQKTTMVVTEKLRKILWTMSLRGGASWNEVREGRPLEFEDFWNVISPAKVPKAGRELCAAEVGSLSLKLFRTKHIPDSAAGWSDSFPSYGLIIDDRILYTADTRYDPEMVIEMDREYRFETIFHDCQFFTGGVHASLEELAGLPADIRERTLLMHYGDNAEAFRSRITELGFRGLVEQWKTYAFPTRA
ncbi:MAG TPA: MBL fold metallo-hydrolase [Rectinemataceae bacterium]|nr:MBL fold metallo-hydrolase [Rectinemataceae bacterium]